MFSREKSSNLKQVKMQQRERITKKSEENDLNDGRKILLEQ